jgi:hypothetical protein
MARSRADELLSRWDELANDLPRPPAARRQARSARPLAYVLLTVVAAVVVVGAVLAIYLARPPEQVGPAPTPSPTPTATASPTPSPTGTAGTTTQPSRSPALTASPPNSTATASAPPAGPLPAPVIARAAYPYPDAQTPWADATAVVGGSLWIADASANHLVRISTATNTVLATINVDPSSLIAGDGQLWTLSPVGLVPGPPTLTVSRVDLAQNVVVATDFPQISAVGLGYLWAISLDGGLQQIDPASGAVLRSWAGVTGQAIDVGCGRLWIHGFGGAEQLASFDPASGSVGTAIDASAGAGIVHETSSGCYVVLGNPGGGASFGVTGTETGTLASVDESGIVAESPQIGLRVHIAGDTFWTSTDAGIIEQIDPLTAAPIGPAWQLPTDELPTNPKFVDWRLISDGADLWLLTATSATHLGITTAP